MPRSFPQLSFDIRSEGSDRWTFQEIFVERVYDEVVDTVGDCNTILDLGANIGLASLFFSACFPKSELLCVEANKSTFTLLEKNLRPLVEEGRAVTRHAAAWSSDGFVEGVDDPVPTRFSRFQVRAALEPETSLDNVPAQIPAVSIGTLLDHRKWDTVDLVKIDIEGAEVQLFANDTSWLDRVNCIAVEFHDDTQERSGWPDILSEHGLSEVLTISAHTHLAIRK